MKFEVIEVERKGADVWVITTRGFGDTLDIARTNRTVLYDIRALKPASLVPRQRVMEVDERMAFDGSVLRVSRMATTMMACVGDKSGADGWQTALLQSAPKWSLSGSTLTLTGHDVTVTLQDKRVLHPDLPLTGTAWVVTTLLRQEGQVRSQALDAARPTLTIAADGQVSGSAGCNRMTGTAEISGSNVTFHLGTTRMMCAPDVMQVEQQVLEALTGATEATVDSDTLTIHNRANDTGLILRSE